MNDLELVDTDDLIEELFRRSDAGVVVLTQTHTDDGGETRFRYYGSPFEVAGMIEFAKQDVLTRPDGPSEDIL